MPVRIFLQLRKDFFGALGIMVVSLPLGLAINAAREHPLPLCPLLPEERLTEGMEVKFGQEARLPGKVELEEVMSASENKIATLVDARESAFFERGRIPGSIHLSRINFREKYLPFAEGRDKEQRIIVYCSESACPDSTVVAKALLLLGFLHVDVYTGGWEEWRAAEMPQEP